MIRSPVRTAVPLRTSSLTAAGQARLVPEYLDVPDHLTDARLLELGRIGGRKWQNEQEEQRECEERLEKGS